MESPNGPPEANHRDRIDFQPSRRIESSREPPWRRPGRWRANLAADSRPRKRLIIAGGGIGGLCCAFELMDRGHDVTVLEASGRPGGHVKTIHDPLPDGLYADVGAEHFGKPDYVQYRKVRRQVPTTGLAYPRRRDMLRRIAGKWYTEAQLQDPTVVKPSALTSAKVDYIAQHGWANLPELYFRPLPRRVSRRIPAFRRRTRRTRSDTAEQTARERRRLRRGIGIHRPAARGRRSAASSNEVSALFALWQRAIAAHRGVPVHRTEVFRLRGGNQVLTDTFAAKLGERVRLGCPITAIEHGNSAVTVHFREFGEPRKLEAEYLVCCIPLGNLAKIPVTPAWPASKAYVLNNTTFSSSTRVVLQSRTKFWKHDLPSINLETGDGTLPLVWQSADEVPTERAILLGGGRPGRFSRRGTGHVCEALSGKIPDGRTERTSIIGRATRGPTTASADPFRWARSSSSGRTRWSRSAGFISPATMRTISPGGWTPPPARPTASHRSSTTRDEPGATRSRSLLIRCQFDGLAAELGPTHKGSFSSSSGALAGSPQAFFTSVTTSYAMNPLAAWKMTL